MSEMAVIRDAPTRVCHVISSFRPVIGGAERATETLTRALVAEGHDVVVLTRRYKREDPAHELIGGVRVRRLGWPGRGKVRAATFAIHAILVLMGPYRAYRIVHAQSLDTPVLVGLCARWLLRRRLVVTIHGETPILAAAGSRARTARVRAMVRSVDRFTAISPEVTEALLGVGASRQRIVAIPNPIDLEVFRTPTPEERAEARQRLGLGSDDIVVLYLGRLRDWKRVDLLIDAFAHLGRQDGVTLLVAGDGPEAASLRDRAAATGARIRLDGPTDDPVRYLWTADLFVLPSGDHATKSYEGLSVALLEAMATGLPPIVSASPGNEVVVRDGKNGLAFQVGDREGLVDALRRAIDDPSLRARLGAEAARSVQRDYGSRSVASRVAGVYAQLAARGRA